MGRTKDTRTLEERNAAALLAAKEKLAKAEANAPERTETKNAIEQKGDGAVVQIDKTVKLDTATESGLGDGLETNNGFVNEAEKINLLRNLVAGVAEYAISQETKNTEKIEKAEDKVNQTKVELEKKITDPFTKAAYNKLADRNKTILLGYLIKNSIKPEKSQIVKMERVTWADQNVVYFSDNGYLMKLTNKKEIAEKGKKLETESEKALYMLVSPDDQIVARDLHYNIALSTLEKKAGNYQIQLNKEFNEDEKPFTDEVSKDGLRTLTKKALQEWIEEIKENKDDEEYLREQKAFNSLIPSQQEILLKVSREEQKKFEAEPFTVEEFKNFFDTVKNNNISREDVITTNHFKIHCTKPQKKEVLEYFDTLGKADSKKDVVKTGEFTEEEFLKFKDEVENKKTAREEVIIDERFKNNCNKNQKREILKIYDNSATAETAKEIFEAMSLQVKSGKLKREELLVSPEYLNLNKLRQDILFQQLLIKERADGVEPNVVDNLKGASEEYLNQYIKKAATLDLELVSSADWFLTLPTQQRNLVLNACIRPDQTLTAASDEDFARYSNMALVSTPKSITSQEWFKTLVVEQRVSVLDLCLKVNPDFNKFSQADFKTYIEILELKTVEDVSAADWFKTLTPEQQEVALKACQKPEANLESITISEDDMLNFESQIKAAKMTAEELKNDKVFQTLAPEQQARLLKASEIKPKEFDPSIAGYSESIGIKKEEFNEFPEFLDLKPEQQKLVLETLRRSSLVLAKAQGRKTFAEEKGKKPFYKIGFHFNEKYHKKRHEVEAVKSIEAQGLAGYSKSEFALLINVVKNGLEVKENGEVDFLSEARMSTGLDKKLINDYNLAARTYIEIPKNTKDESEIQKKYHAELILNKFKSEILKTANPEDMNNLREAENNIKLFEYLSANKETERIINKLSAESLSGGSKAKMMLGAHSDKAGYMAMGLSMKTFARFAMGINYSIAPAVAAIVGGIRAYNTNRKDIDEKELYAQIGFEDAEKGTSKFSKTLNQAFAEKEDGQGVGLSNKLDALVSRFEIVQEKIKTENDPAEIEKNKKELENLTSLINHRIIYTIGRMNDREVSYGPAEERGINFYKLNESLIAAQAVGSYEFNPFSKISNYNENLNGKTTKFTRADTKAFDVERRDGESDKKYQKRSSEINNKLEKLHQIGFEDRLASFMGYKEDIRANKEFVYMAKKVVVGAAVGATFAAAGVWVADKLGLDVFFAKQWGSFKGLFSHHDAVKVLTPGAKIPTIETGTPKAPTPEVNKNIVGTDKISNEGLNGKHDSVWRSLREIFKNKSSELGYKGDPNDASALNKWAETQTANTIHHSGNITDRVSEGNQVTLMHDGDHLKVVVEQGTGAKPEHLIRGGGNSRVAVVERVASGDIHMMNLKNVDQIPTDNNTRVSELVSLKDNMDKNVAYNALEEKVLAQNLHFKPENLTRINTDHFSYKIPGKGEIMLGLKNGTTTIERLYDTSGKIVPVELINEVKRNLSVDRFIGRGGVDKVLSLWNNLSVSNKAGYQDLISFKNHKLEPSQLLNKICENFHVNANKGVMIDSATNHFVYNGNRNFDMDLKGLGKLVKVLARRG